MTNNIRNGIMLQGSCKAYVTTIFILSIFIIISSLIYYDYLHDHHTIFIIILIMNFIIAFAIKLFIQQIDV